MDFAKPQRADQSMFFQRTGLSEMTLKDFPYRLEPKHRLLNLAPMIRELAQAYFGPPRNISWHLHANHALSSQVCCLNFFMPLAMHPEQLGIVIGSALDIAPPKMLPIENGADGNPWFIGFEWIGCHDYLGEWPETGQATRGSNVTSADAIVQFEHEGKRWSLLIEWKYTESYGAPLKTNGNPTRVARYSEKAFSPDGPLRSDLNLKLEDFFWEPFYQLLRQQMLAFRMERGRECEADRVSVLHISPSGNTAVRRVTAPALRRFGDDAFKAFPTLLIQPDRFLSRTTEQVFAASLASPLKDSVAQAWATYLVDRYNFLTRT